jgi:hypothetical protein
MAVRSFYVRWRQRFSSEMLNTFYTDSGGWKQVIVGTGDQPGKVFSSCSSLELRVQNINQRGFPMMYISCTGSTLHGAYDPFEEPFNGSDFEFQNARPTPYCLYSQKDTSYFPSIGNCFGYAANEWMTFQMRIQFGRAHGRRVQGQLHHPVGGRRRRQRALRQDLAPALSHRQTRPRPTQSPTPGTTNSSSLATKSPIPTDAKRPSTERRSLLRSGWTAALQSTTVQSKGSAEPRRPKKDDDPCRTYRRCRSVWG